MSKVTQNFSEKTFLHKMAGHGVTGHGNQLAFFPQASLKRLSKYRFRHPSLLFLALSSLHECTDLWLGVPEGSQIWLMIHFQVTCIDFQEGQRSRSLEKMILDIKPFIPVLNFIKNLHSTNWFLGDIGDWQLKQNPSDIVSQGPHSWCGGNKTQGFGHRLFSASDSSCVTHVSFPLSPQPPSRPSSRRPRLATVSIYLKRTRVPPLTQLSWQRPHRQVSVAKQVYGLGVGCWLGGWLVLWEVP